MSEKGQELIDFAKEHGFEIHPRSNPEDWATTLAEGDGQCPCHHAPTCPCEETIVRLTDPARSPENQACGCTFFVSKAYLEHYKKQPWRPEVATPPTTTYADSGYVKTAEVDPELGKKAIQKVNTYLTVAELLKSGELSQVDEIMRQELNDASNCDMCMDDARLVLDHSVYIQTACSQGRTNCEDELARILTETVAIIDENFMMAGYSRSGADLPAATKSSKSKNAWLEFSHNIGRDPLLSGLPQKYKMKVAAGLYRNEYDTIEEAMAAIPRPTTFS